MRDDLSKLPLPSSAKKYARMTSKDLGSNWSKKVDMYINMAADVTNQGDRKQGFKNKDASGKVPHAFKEAVETAVERMLLDGGPGAPGSLSEAFAQEAKPFRFVTCCVNADGQDIMDMVDQAKSISYQTFFSNVPLSEVFQSGIAGIYYWTPAQCLAGGIDYEEVRGNYPLTMKKDWHISYHKSVYQGRPCLYFVHSAIEYVFVRV